LKFRGCYSVAFDRHDLPHQRGHGLREHRRPFTETGEGTARSTMWRSVLRTEWKEMQSVANLNVAVQQQCDRRGQYSCGGPPKSARFEGIATAH
jgi:hypothetical protein